MNTLSFLSTIAACAGLAACSSATTTTPTAPTTTNIGGQAAHVGATYSATQVGVLTDIALTPTNSNGLLKWLDFGGGIRAFGYESANVLAIGGYNNNTFIKGLTGELSSPPQTGTASYTGRYAVAQSSSLTDAPISIDVDFNALTFQDTTSFIDVLGTITGQQFTGTVTYAGTTAPLEGGFFGTNEMVGAFGNSTIAGVFYGTKP